MFGSTAGSLTVAIRVVGSFLDSSVRATSSIDTSTGVSSSEGHSASGGVGGIPDSSAGLLTVAIGATGT